ncbi:protease modulator HflC [Microaerobacter geothermalis]|uniref:protease modulator HflC n=1 Tax=Microaerobacter geothermalis TaxID=674972 RepID=UPI001F3DAA39|nr:protease modulator HflC [Microaerobacter geothermalis]MCF6092967.1 protease modulator HflC [Microaerobacter geothermalis]
MDDEKVIDINSRKPELEWKKYSKVGFAILILVLLAGLIFSNLFIVQEGEYKIIRQFGEVVRILDEPGLNYKIPFIQTAESLPKFQLVYDSQPTEINTKDKKKMMIDNYVVWRIEDPLKMIQTARTVENAEARLGEAVYSIIRADLGQLNFDEIVNDEASARRGFNEIVTQKVDDVLRRDGYGIDVIDVRVKRTDLPDQNEQSVFNRMISERRSKAQEYLSQGEAEATKIKAETDRQVKEMLAEAEAKAKAIEGEGEKEAAKIYNEAYGKDPEFYRLYRTLLSYETTMKGKPVIVLPISSPYAKLLMGNTQ